MSNPRKLAPEQEAELCLRYSNGERVDDIVCESGISLATLYKKLRQQHIDLRQLHAPATRLSPADQQEACKRYLRGDSTYTVSQQFGTSRSTIVAALKHHKIKRRSHEECVRIYACDHNFFANIDTESKAYWLGFLAADGCITSHSNRAENQTISVALSVLDKKHLERLAKDVQSSHPIKEYPRKPNNACRLYIVSQQLADDLSRHGVTKQKTFTLRWPESLPPQLLRHYTRGVIDGDGCFYVQKPRKYAKTPTVGIYVVSNIIFLKGLQTFLMETCGLRETKIRQFKNRDARVGQLFYNGNRQVKRIFRLLYHRATIFLPRKFWKVFPILYPNHPAVLRRQQRETAP